MKRKNETSESVAIAVKIRKTDQIAEFTGVNKHIE